MHPVQSGWAKNRDDAMKMKTVFQKLVRLAREEDAVALVEMAMTAVALMGLLFGVIACGIALYVYHFTVYGADQGATFAQLRGNTWSAGVATNCSTSAPPSFSMPYDCTVSSTDVQNYVQSLAADGGITKNVTVTTTWPGTNDDGTTTGCTTNANAQGCFVSVTVNYTLSLLPYPKQLNNISMSSTSQKIIVQ